jgi:sulfatase maturation enzyme AslB (radical SAM superfamily)
MRNVFRFVSGHIVTGLGTMHAAVRPPVAPPQISLYFDLNNGCNLNCTMCGNDRRNASAQHVMDQEVFRRRVLPIFGRVVDFQFGCLFEPMMIPYFEEAMKLIGKALKPGIKGKIISNATLLTDRNTRSMIETEIFRIISFSMDAADETLFQQIRRGANYNKVIRNIESLMAFKQQSGSAVRVEFNFTIMRQNIRDLPALVRRAAELGIDGVTTHKLYPDDVNIVDDEYYRELQEYLAGAEDTATRYGIGFVSQTYSTKQMSESVPPEISGNCGFTETPASLRLDCRMNLYTPCHKITGALGNIHNREIDDILNGWKFRGMLYGFRNPAPSTCARCYMYLPGRCSLVA